MHIPLALTIVAIESKLFGIEFYLDCLALARLKRHTGKTLLLDGTKRLVACCGREVDLGNLVGSHPSSVFYLE